MRIDAGELICAPCGAELGFAPEEDKFIQSSFAQSCQIALKKN